MSEKLTQVVETLAETSKVGFLFNKQSTVEKIKVLLDDAEQDFKVRLKKARDRNDDLEDELDDIQRQLKKQKNRLEESEQEKADLSEQNCKKQQNIDRLQQTLEDERNQTALRDRLVSELISAENQNTGLLEFERVLRNDFLAFAKEESSLSDEAGALLLLQEIAEDLKMVSSFPEFHTAKTVAVAGGFSAGKSEFISSLFSDDTLNLPSSIEPTTAIPTYVINSDNKEPNRLIGVNNQNGVVDLLSIDPSLASKLNHEFIQSFNFPLKKIMPYMFLTTKMAYKHICFVDTPGYNPSSNKDSHTADDINIAQEFVANADALIWVIGADVNGTIPLTDIQFLKKVLGDSDKPLYFILNKADLRAKEDIIKIMVEFKSVLDKENIKYLGVSAYNSLFSRELACLKGKQKLSTFLEKMNKETDKQAELLHKLYQVDSIYQYAILKEIKERKLFRKALDDIGFDLNAANFERGKHIVYDQLDEIAARFNVVTEETHLKQLETVIQKLRLAIEHIFGKKSDIQRPIIDAEKIEIEGFTAKNDDLERENRKEEIKDIENIVGGFGYSIFGQMFR